jgi:hypothetical protein
MMKYQVDDDDVVVEFSSLIVRKGVTGLSVYTAAASQQDSETTRMGDGIKSKTVSLHSCELSWPRGRKKELGSLSKGGGFEGGPFDVLGYVPDLRSSFQEPSAIGKGVLSTLGQPISSVNCPGERDLAFCRPQSRTRDLKLVELAIRRRFRAVEYDVPWLCVVTSTVLDLIEIPAKQVEGVVTGYYNKRNE